MPSRKILLVFSTFLKQIASVRPHAAFAMFGAAKEKVDEAQAQAADAVSTASDIASNATSGNLRQRVAPVGEHSGDAAAQSTSEPRQDSPTGPATPAPTTPDATAPDGAAAAPAAAGANPPYEPINRPPPKLTLTLGQVLLIMGAGCLSSTSALLYWLKPGMWALAQWGILGLGAGLAASYSYYKNKRTKAEINQLVSSLQQAC